MGLVADNELQVHGDSRISGHHFRIEREEDAFFIIDDSSAGGTLVNGSLITRRRLHGGEDVVAGDTWFRFRLR